VSFVEAFKEAIEKNNKEAKDRAFKFHFENDIPRFKERLLAQAVYGKNNFEIFSVFPICPSEESELFYRALQDYRADFLASHGFKPIDQNAIWGVE
jgi:hypothetical protein